MNSLEILRKLTRVLQTQKHVFFFVLRALLQSSGQAFIKINRTSIHTGMRELSVVSCMYYKDLSTISDNDEVGNMIGGPPQSVVLGDKLGLSEFRHFCRRARNILYVETNAKEINKVSVCKCLHCLVFYSCCLDKDQWAFVE